MGIGTMVIMESGSRWPAWLDQWGPSATSLELVSQRPGEAARQFAERAANRLLELGEAPLTSVLVCNAHAGTERMALRTALLHGLVGQAQAAGRGHVVIAADGDYAQRCDLVRLAARLNDEIENEIGVAVRFRAMARDRRDSVPFRHVA